MAKFGSLEEWCRKIDFNEDSNGVYTKDAGQVIVDGKKFVITTHKKKKRNSIYSPRVKFII
ncbi:MAG: hypothetical protein ACLRPW_05110 [Intestinibacter sp.]